MFFASIGIAVVALLVFAALWAVFAYNRLVRLNALSKEGWSGIDVQLKRRYDLIPNLVSVVKQYSIHEKETLERVTEMRSFSMGTTKIDKKAEAEAGLTQALKSLFAVAENYPELRANENFLALQRDLGEIEQDLQLARRYYNGAVRNYNIAVEMFPSNIVARMLNFSYKPYFKVSAEEEREAPKVDF